MIANTEARTVLDLRRVSKAEHVKVHKDVKIL